MNGRVTNAVDEYIAAQPEALRPKLEQVRDAIRRAVGCAYGARFHAMWLCAVSEPSANWTYGLQLPRLKLGLFIQLDPEVPLTLAAQI